VTQTARHTVAFNALKPGVDAIRPELDAAIARVLDSGWFVMGPELSRFESAFAAYLGEGVQAVGVGSGTDAIRIGLQAVGVGPGDEVLAPANAGVPPIAAIVDAGARPVFCDVDAQTHGLDPNEIDARRTARTKAILVVHLYGQPAAIRPIVALARAHGLQVLEDCAQAHGATVARQKVGTFGDAAAFSFYPTKNLGALGDGGAVVSRDPQVIERARLLRVYGWRQKYVSEMHSVVSRLDELQAALLAAKLPHLDAWNATRRALAERYSALINGCVEVLPEEGVFHLYVVRTRQRDALRAYLHEHGIGTDVHYPLPAHRQTPYAEYATEPLPVTERLADEVLSLPLYPELSADAVEYVAKHVRAFFSQHGA
jgi:dTDP-4-amino-4,6-dideoxygalactose transaminase